MGTLGGKGLNYCQFGANLTPKKLGLRFKEIDQKGYKVFLQ